MRNLNVIPKGAVLIRNGIIEEVGPAQRIENLIGARNAREIDAAGRVIMPAFVDADVALAAPGAAADPEGEARGQALRLMSRKRVLARAGAAAAECARYGTLAVGAHTRAATDLPNIRKILRAHQALQLRPLRIRSIFSPPFPQSRAMVDALVSRWLPAVIGKKLSAVLELAAAGGEASETPDTGFDMETMRPVAVTASGLSYAIRLRCFSAPDSDLLQLAASAGAIAILAPLPGRTIDAADSRIPALQAALAELGCVRVVPATEVFDNREEAAGAMRHAIDEGAAIAISSSYRAAGPATLNMQYLLHLAACKPGLTVEEAITATTWNPACSLRLSHVTGSLEPGKHADLLIMDVPDYRELARRAGHTDAGIVVRGGQILSRGAALSFE